MPLNPGIAALLAQAQAAGRPAISAGTPADARALLAQMLPALGPGPAIRRVETMRVPTRGGSIGARVYADVVAPEGLPAGLLVYFHGGGWVIGGLEDFDAFARTMARRSGCAVLMVDYRLAPEAPFPAAVDDAVDATLWAAAHLRALAGAEVPLLVGGDSAGGNLAAVVAAELHGRLPIALQLLIYPVTDSDVDTPSYHAYDAGYALQRQDMVWFFGHYAPGVGRGDPRLNPAARSSLSGLPPAHVVTAEFDVLRDEGEAYARRLAQAGVPTTLRRYDGLTHGFIRLHNLVPEVDQAVGDLAAACAAAAGASRSQGGGHG